MTRAFHNSEERSLERLSRVKTRTPPPIPLLGPELIAFFKNDVQKRQTKFGAIADCWGKLIPETLIEHTSLESFTRGQLTVLVDSSSHLYQLKTLLLSGLQKQLLIVCKSAGLRKISLRLGRWYDCTGDGPEDRKLRF